MTRLSRLIGIRNQNYLTRDKGEQAYKILQEQLQATPEGRPLVLVFPPAQLVDSSFADESAVRLGAEILKDKYGERCVLLEGLTSDSIKNFNAVISLRRIKLPLLAVEATGEWQILGGLEESLAETLKLVHQQCHLTAGDLVAQLGMAVNTASTRLKRLHNLHLVRREFEVSEKGLQYFYYFWKWNGSNTSI
jgi:hypothetical protein